MVDIVFTESDAVELAKIQQGKKKNGEKIESLTKHLYLTYLIVGILAFSVGLYVSYKRLKNTN